MKTNLFRRSLLTVGVVTAMGIAVTANASDVTYDAANVFTVSNKASAIYTVTGNTTQQTAQSNEVTISVSETGAFSLVATVADGDNNADTNANLPIDPEADAVVDYTHTLTNAGNVADTYTIDIANASGDNFEYDLASTTITYQKKDATGANIGTPVTINNGGQITLEAGQSADITVSAQSATARVLKQKGVLTVSATSSYLKGKGQTATAINTDSAITTTPVYSIIKSAETNLQNNRLDLSNPDSYVDYTITVKNEGNADGTLVNITDALPEGLVAIQSGEANYVAPIVTAGGNPVGGASTTSTATISNNGKMVSVTNQNIKQNEIITLTFRAKASDTATVGSDFVNYAVVRDDVNDDGTFDLVDSTGDSSDTSVTENTYENPAFPDAGDGDNTDAAVTPTTQSREITITKPANKEVALQSSTAYVYTITNGGTDVTEADARGEVLLTVAPTTNHAAITIGRVFVDANANGILDNGEIILTANTNGQYDLNTAVPAGLAPNETVLIGVEVTTNGSGSNLGGDSDIGGTEVMTVTVSPVTIVDGTQAPAKAVTTSSTTMQGIDLFKYQAVADCKTSPTAIPNSSWVTTPIAGAVAGSCVFYRLEATNTFTSTSITGITLSDTLVPALTYQNNFSSTASINSQPATASVNGQNISGTFNALAPTETGNIYFSARISQTGAN